MAKKKTKSSVAKASKSKSTKPRASKPRTTKTASSKPSAQKPPAVSKPVVVTVADHAMNDIHQLAARLSAKGMDVKQVLPITGVISGSCAADNMTSLQQVDGVQSVEPEYTAVLPGPGEPQ